MAFLPCCVFAGDLGYYKIRYEFEKALGVPHTFADLTEPDRSQAEDFLFLVRILIHAQLQLFDGKQPRTGKDVGSLSVALPSSQVTR